MKLRLVAIALCADTTRGPCTVSHIYHATSDDGSRATWVQSGMTLPDPEGIAFVSQRLMDAYGSATKRIWVSADTVPIKTWLELDKGLAPSETGESGRWKVESER